MVAGCAPYQTQSALGHFSPLPLRIMSDRLGSRIGIGGHLAVPPLPHHRAYGSRTRRFDGVKLGSRHGVGARAGLWGADFATTGSVPWQPPTGVSPWCAGFKASEYWFFCRIPLMSRQSYLPLPIVRAFGHRFRLGLSVAPPFGFGVPH
jgi:hypothetical protein